MTARLGNAMGRHWGGVVRAIDIISVVAAFGALGGLPALVGMITRYVRYALKSLRRLRQLSTRRGDLWMAFLLLMAAGTDLLALQGCAPVVLTAPAPRPGEIAADSPGGIRMMGPDHRFTDVSTRSAARRARGARAGEAFSILALSGGGADGAFGAGALVGLTRSGTRPQFSVVTGVSAGAFLAAFAFLGPAWDQQLIDAYTSGRAEHLLQPRGLGVVFDSSGYRGRPLEQLVDHCLSDALLQAVAREAASGRLLLVATTNVDTGETVVWDLGSIALNAGPRAKSLFRDVLVASASVPGMFPPVIIRIQDDWGDYSEAHVDGTASIPFLVPPAFLQPAVEGSRRTPATVYVIVDGRLGETPRPIRLRLRTIVSRSISTGLTHMARTTLELTATTAQLQGAQLEYSAIPVAYPKLAPFDFDASTMRPLFDYGHDCARTGRLWIVPGHAADPDDHGPSAAPTVPCPAEDAFIGRIAAR